MNFPFSVQTSFFHIVSHCGFGYHVRWSQWDSLGWFSLNQTLCYCLYKHISSEWFVYVALVICMRLLKCMSIYRSEVKVLIVKHRTKRGKVNFGSFIGLVCCFLLLLFCCSSVCVPCCLAYISSPDGTKTVVPTESKGWNQKAVIKVKVSQDWETQKLKITLTQTSKMSRGCMGGKDARELGL